MKGEKFAKVFEVKGADVLYYKIDEIDMNDDTDCIIKAMVSFEGMAAVISFGFGDDVAKRDLEFDKINFEKAEIFYKMMVNQLSE